MSYRVIKYGDNAENNTAIAVKK